MKINALKTEHGVNMGDHGADVVTALDVTESTTVGELMRVAARGHWGSESELRGDVSVTLRIAQPVVPQPLPDFSLQAVPDDLA